MRRIRTVLVTGGHGFIGSNFIKHWLIRHPHDLVVNVDGMTYAARPEFLDQWLATEPVRAQRYRFIACNLEYGMSVGTMIKDLRPDLIVHFAAESHVCRSIEGPRKFLNSNVIGTFNLLEAVRQHHPRARFHHISTDEVFGELGQQDPAFSEQTPMAPRSPYAATKASSDMLVQCFRETYGLDTTISNCSNNYGQNQHEEKLIPATIDRIFHGQPVRINGTGLQVRDWLHVQDHCRAVDHILHHGKIGERYLVGGRCERTVQEIVAAVYAEMKDQLGLTQQLHTLHVNDRPTDDFRYAIDCSKLEKTGWEPIVSFDEGLRETVSWYLAKLKSRVGGVVSSGAVVQGRTSV